MWGHGAWSRANLLVLSLFREVLLESNPSISFVEGICVAMSRCFPFPPPVYEKKSRTDGGDLLKKEKDRERKQKKEKKVRQKGEGKEKKDNDRSDGKHRDKKDRKEKRRDKKDRDKDKDRTRTSVSDEKLNLQFEHDNGNKTTVEKKRLGIPEGGTGETFTQKGKENDVIAKGITVEKKLPVHSSGHNGDKIARKNHLSALPKDAKVIQELGQKVKDDDRGARNHLDGKFSGDFKRDKGVFKLVPKASAAKSEENIMRDDCRKLGGQRIGGETRGAGNVMADGLSAFDSKRDEGMIRVVNKATNTLGENKEANMKVGNRRLSDQGIGDELRFTGNVISESLSGTTQTKIGLAKLPEEVSKKSIEGKERIKQKESDHKHNDRDNEKKRKQKDKDRDRKKEEKSKEKDELEKAETDKLNKSIKNDLTATSNVKPSPILNAAVAAEGDPRKWKDSEQKQNGFLNANEPVPSKLPGSPSQLVTENGRILKASQASIFSPPGLWGAVNNVTVGNKERKINGLIEAHALSSPATQSFSISPPEPLLTPSQVEQGAEGSRKPPHPDTKCLLQHEILTVPKMEEWSNFDDQEWLFQESERQSKRSKMCSYAVDETPQVWSETLRIDSADIYALPYVVPY